MSQAGCAVPLEGAPGAGRSRARPSAAAAARAAQPAGNGLQGQRLPPTGGSSSKRARQLPHKMIASRPAGRAQSDATYDRSGRRRSAVRLFYLDQVFSTQRRSPLTIERHRSVAGRFPFAMGRRTTPDGRGARQARDRATRGQAASVQPYDVSSRARSRLASQACRGCRSATSASSARARSRSSSRRRS